MVLNYEADLCWTSRSSFANQFIYMNILGMFLYILTIVFTGFIMVSKDEFSEVRFLVYFGKFLLMSPKPLLHVLVMFLSQTANGFLFFIITEFIRKTRLENFGKTFIVTALILKMENLRLFLPILYEHVYSVSPYSYHISYYKYVVNIFLSTHKCCARYIFCYFIYYV